MLWLSPSVHGDLNREAAEAVRIIEVEAAKNREDVYVTHIRDGRHGNGTRHYMGDAFDILPLMKTLMATVRMRLGNGYDCVIESDHWHIEWDPR